MKRETYYIHRTVGHFTDTLLHLWGGEDLPTFSNREPYYFSDKATAERVSQRLAAKYHTADAIPGVCGPAAITYKVIAVAWDDETCPCCGNDQHCSEQHVAQFI